MHSGKVLRLFRYSVEQSKIDQAIRDNGWQGRVVQVDSIQEADAIIAVKLTAGGKHQNLSQVGGAWVVGIPQYLAMHGLWQSCTWLLWQLVQM